MKYDRYEYLANQGKLEILHHKSYYKIMLTVEIVNEFNINT